MGYLFAIAHDDTEVILTCLYGDLDEVQVLHRPFRHNTYERSSRREQERRAVQVPRSPLCKPLVFAS